MYLQKINKYKFNTYQCFFIEKKKYNSGLCKNNNNLLKEFLKEKQLKLVFSYEDLHLDITRKTIMKDT